MRGRRFTLVELMAVMAILAIVMVAVVPALDGMAPGSRLDAGARHVASTIEAAQSEAIGQRKEFVIAYDFDQNAYWIVLPQRADADPSQEEQGSSLLGGAEEEMSALKRPEDDMEHGKAPPDPNKQNSEEGREQQAEELPDYVDRDNLEPTKLPDDVEFEVIVIDGEEKRDGIVYISFDKSAGTGSHVVGLKLADELTQDSDRHGEKWVLFNALTRTIEYHEQRPQIPTLEPEGEGAAPAPAPAAPAGGGG